MAEPAHRRSILVAPLDPAHDGGPAGSRLEDLEVDAGAAELRHEEVGVSRLVPRGLRPVIDALVADHLLKEVDDLEAIRSHSSSLPAVVPVATFVNPAGSYGSTVRHITMWGPRSSCSKRSPNSKKPARL